MFMQDKAGAINFSSTRIAVSGAYHKALDINNTQFLSLGFQAGVVQRNVNFGNVTFEDQFNGTTGYSDPTGERLPENNFSFGDYSVGLNCDVFSPKASKIASPLQVVLFIISISQPSASTIVPTRMLLFLIANWLQGTRPN